MPQTLKRVAVDEKQLAGKRWKHLQVALHQEQADALQRVISRDPAIKVSQLLRDAVAIVIGNASRKGSAMLSVRAIEGLSSLALLLKRDLAAVAEDCVNSIADSVSNRCTPRIVEELRSRQIYSGTPKEVLLENKSEVCATQTPISHPCKSQAPVTESNKTILLPAESEIDVVRVKADVIDRILSLYTKRKPLNITAVKKHSPGLIETVYRVRPYWGWRLALEESGLSYETILSELTTETQCRLCGRWYRRLTGHLQFAHNRTPREYLAEYPGEESVPEAERRFWHRYQPPLPHWEKVWSPEYILDRIAAYARAGVQLHVRSIMKSDPALFATCLLHFSSWDEALTKAGLDPKQIRRNREGRHLSREEVVEELRRRWHAGIPLQTEYRPGSPSISLGECEPESSQERMEHLRLMNAARRRFGTYREALLAAGIPPEQVTGQRYTESDVAQAVAEVHRVAAIKEHQDRARAACEMQDRYTPIINVRYGSWRKMALEVGLEPWRISATPYPVAKAALEGMASYVRAGNPLRYPDLYRFDKALAKAVSRRLGRFEDACQHLERFTASVKETNESERND
jgi:hypothetical protein